MGSASCRILGGLGSPQPACAVWVRAQTKGAEVDDHYSPLQAGEFSKQENTQAGEHSVLPLVPLLINSPCRSRAWRWMTTTSCTPRRTTSS